MTGWEPCGCWVPARQFCPGPGLDIEIQLADGQRHIARMVLDAAFLNKQAVDIDAYGRLSWHMVTHWRPVRSTKG